MSSRRIQKRLDKLFTDIREAGDVTTEKQAVPEAPREAPPVKPAEKRAKAPRKAAATPAKAQPSKPLMGTRSLGPIPQLLPRSEKTGQPEMLSIPFRADAISWNMLEVVNPSEKQTWGPEEQLLVKQVADQLSLALENARLFQQTRRQAEELQVLNEMGRDLAAQLDITGVVETIYGYTTRLMDTHHFKIALFSAETQRINFPIAIVGEARVSIGETALAGDLTEYVIRSHRPLFLPEDVPARAKALGVDLPAEETVAC